MEMSLTSLKSDKHNTVSLFNRKLSKKRGAATLDNFLDVHLGECSGTSFVHSTRLCVCDNKRISAHRVFAEYAGRSKTSMGWFFGFKLHLIINEKGEVLGIQLTPGNTDDRKPLPDSVVGLQGSLYGDKGYISKDMRETLRQQGINLMDKVHPNMKPEPLWTSDEEWLRKRVIIESVIKELKTQTQQEHSRHRSPVNFQVNVVTVLIAYQLLEHKPSVNLRKLQEINDGPMLFNF